MDSIIKAINCDEEEIQSVAFEALDEIPFIGYEYLSDYL